MKELENIKLTVNNRYNIYFINNTYVIYDILKGGDIPQYVIKLADKIIEGRK